MAATGTGTIAKVKSIVVILLLYLNMSTAIDMFMPGAVPIREPDNHFPIMYSSAMPIIYKFKVPQWNRQTMKIQFWSNHNNCTASDKYDDGYPCPVMYHMNNLIDNFTANMTSWKSLFPSVDRNTKKYSSDFLQDPTILWNKEICSNLRIEPHFKEFLTSSSQIAKYIEVLMQCTENRTAFNLQIVNMTDVSTSLENQYHYTFTSFTSDYWNMLEGSTQQTAAILGWTTLETTLMLHQYMEAHKWVQAVETCKNQQIPWSLINTESLKRLLSLKRRPLEDSHHDLAIPLENISKYFRLPLSDCIFGDDDTFIVRILVPLVPLEAASTNYFVKFHPVPFQTQGKVCSLWDGRESIPFNLGLNGIMPCSCAKSEAFCKGWITEEICTSHGILQEACIHALRSDIEQDILDHCQIKCKTFESAKQPREIVVTQNETTTIKIVPAIVDRGSDTNYAIICRDGTRMDVDFESVGAYEVTFPTHCKLVLRNQSYAALNSKVEIMDGVSFRRLMPYQWRKEVIDNNYDPEKTDDSVITNMEHLDGVDEQLYFLAQKLQDIDQYCSRIWSDTFLWLLVLISLSMNVSLIVVVWQLYKWKKQEIYQSNRLVYSVSHPQDDDFPGNDEPGSLLYNVPQNLSK